MIDKISDSLGLAPMEEVIEGKVVVEAKSLPEKVKKDDDRAEIDYDYARTNFYNIIETGTEALEQMLDVAKASEHPRAYEVVSTIMKTLVDANKDLVGMSEKKKPKETEAFDGKVNNNLFVGSTAELQQLLKDMRKGE
jgi:hypothetical protein|tara:strand:+ start:1463 stop:1876 length:414 start_codon:yes stop_codon:yes gene_type:complete